MKVRKIQPSKARRDGSQVATANHCSSYTLAFELETAVPLFDSVVAVAMALIDISDDLL